MTGIAGSYTDVVKTNEQKQLYKIFGKIKLIQ